MTAPIEIDDPADPRIADYVDIRERDLIGRHNRFIVEGEVVLRAIAASTRFALASVLLASKRLERLADVIAALPAETAVFTASQRVMDAIAGFSIHRGILGVGRRGPGLDADDILARCGPQARVLGLCGIANHDNVGGLFRNAAAFGVDAVLIDATSCDPLYRKAIRVSIGATLRVPFAQVTTGGDMVDAFERNGFETLALTPGAATRLREVHPPARTAVLVGAEGPGLPSDVLARTRGISIAMAPGVDSLNVAVAAGIALERLQSHPASAPSTPSGFPSPSGGGDRKRWSPPPLGEVAQRAEGGEAGRDAFTPSSPAT